MDTTTAVANAAVGAVTAVATSLLLDHIKKNRMNREHQLEVQAAFDAGRTGGWYEGRESVMQNFAERLEPKDFSPVQ